VPRAVKVQFLPHRKHLKYLTSNADSAFRFQLGQFRRRVRPNPYRNSEGIAVAVPRLRSPARPGSSAFGLNCCNIVNCGKRAKELILLCKFPYRPCLSGWAPPFRHFPCCGRRALWGMQRLEDRGGETAEFLGILGNWEDHGPTRSELLLGRHSQGSRRFCKYSSSGVACRRIRNLSRACGSKLKFKGRGLRKGRGSGRAFFFAPGGQCRARSRRGRRMSSLRPLKRRHNPACFLKP
jgi:hypothetical protein